MTHSQTKANEEKRGTCVVACCERTQKTDCDRKCRKTQQTQHVRSRIEVGSVLLHTRLGESVVTTIERTLTAAALFLVISTAGQAGPPPGKGNPNSGNASNSQNSGSPPYDQQMKGQNESHDTLTNLVLAGITLVAARELALSTASVGYKPLPPGIAKNLARGKPLPPGLATRSLSGQFLAGLPKHSGYQWVGAGTDLVLINITSRVVADVLVNALR